MNTQQAAGFLRRVADLECLGQFPETVEGLKEVASLLVSQEQESSSSQFSPTAQSMMGVIITNTWPPKPSYIAGWHICDQLGVDRTQLDCSIPGTKYDKALKELIDAGVVEEVPDLGCRYRLCRPPTV
jgi:hypothetical protein